MNNRGKIILTGIVGGAIIWLIFLLALIYLPPTTTAIIPQYVEVTREVTTVPDGYDSLVATLRSVVQTEVAVCCGGATPCVCPTDDATPTATEESTPTATRRWYPTYTPTATRRVTREPTPTKTFVPSPTPYDTPTSTRTPSVPTGTPTSSVTITETPTPTETLEPTPTKWTCPPCPPEEDGAYCHYECEWDDYKPYCMSLGGTRNQCYQCWLKIR